MDKKAKKRSLGLSKTEKRIIICTAAVVLIALSIYPTVTYLVHQVQPRRFTDGKRQL